MSDKDYTITKIKGYTLGVYVLWFFTLLTISDLIRMLGKVLK